MHYDIRPRDYGETSENRAILLVGKDDNLIHAYYHWANRLYALSFNPDEVYPVVYKPPVGLDVSDTFGRFDRQTWDGTGEPTTFEALRG